MIESLRVRTFLVFAMLAFALIYLLPSFVSLPNSWWFHKKPLNYGLDIQGGAHLVYGVDIDGVMRERTERAARAMAEELKNKSIAVTSVDVTPDHKSIVIKWTDPAAKAKVAAFIGESYSTLMQVISEQEKQIEVRYFDAVLENYRTQVIGQAIEVIRNRVDEFGVAEPVIAAQGKDRILVQLPGISDPARAKELINKTAKLDFRLVDNSMDPAQVGALVAEAEKTGGFALGKDGLSYAQYVRKVNEALRAKLPEHTVISFEKAGQAASLEAGKVAFLLRTDSDVSGDQLEDAFVSLGEYGEPKVSFRFGAEGRKKFAALTEKNVGRNLAIVLDEVIYSAPNIRERIDGEGQISLGSRNAEEAQKEGSLIATALRAGALPAALQQLEERAVGPSLGADSVQKGKTAGLIGMMLVVIFLIIYYKMTGAVAAVCLGLNVVFMLALLSALGATLTLPGIAGITLTMGMAVDANVIIYERIKEELARGVTMKTAVREGFNLAWSAILDSNVTNAIAASVLIYFGSGPVRGFGVTLIVGIATTMVTAVFVAHYLLDVLSQVLKIKKVSI